MDIFDPMNYKDRRDANYKNQAIEYYKKQIELIDKQDNYSKSIRRATWVMAAAIIAQFIIMTIELILK
jgi:hypothetical protein